MPQALEPTRARLPESEELLASSGRCPRSQELAGRAQRSVRVTQCRPTQLRGSSLVPSGQEAERTGAEAASCPRRLRREAVSQSRGAARLLPRARPPCWPQETSSSSWAVLGGFLCSPPEGSHGGQEDRAPPDVPRPSPTRQHRARRAEGSALEPSSDSTLPPRPQEEATAGRLVARTFGRRLYGCPGSSPAQLLLHTSRGSTGSRPGPGLYAFLARPVSPASLPPRASSSQTTLPLEGDSGPPRKSDTHPSPPRSPCCSRHLSGSMLVPDDFVSFLRSPQGPAPGPAQGSVIHQPVLMEPLLGASHHFR